MNVIERGWGKIKLVQLIVPIGEEAEWHKAVSVTRFLTNKMVCSSYFGPSACYTRLLFFYILIPL